MNTKSFLNCFLVISLALIMGCAATKDFPKYDQVLVYDRPFDYTYLKTLEALNTFSEWTLEETDKNKGLILIRNTQYGHLFDKDKWVVKFRVESLGRKKTSVSIDPVSQKNEKGGELLQRIDDLMKAGSSGQTQSQSLALS